MTPQKEAKNKKRPQKTPGATLEKFAATLGNLGQNSKKNGQKWPKMAKNAQKWSKIVKVMVKSYDLKYASKMRQVAQTWYCAELGSNPIHEAVKGSIDI